MSELLLLIVTGAFIIFILNNAKARDVARAYGKINTQRRGFVFLDDSVALKSMKFKRTDKGLTFARSYAFEYNESDYNRYKAKIEMVGYKVKNIQYFHPDHIEQV